MKQEGIYFILKPGAKREYIKLHKNIWPQLKSVLDEAGIHNYSIWNIENKLFAYYEVENKTHMKKVLENSVVYQNWRTLMENYIYKDFQSGKKEWFMKKVFFHKGGILNGENKKQKKS